MSALRPAPSRIEIRRSVLTIGANINRLSETTARSLSNTAGGTSSVTLQVNNTGSTIVHDWSLALQVRALTGASGTVTITNAIRPTTGTNLLDGDSVSTFQFTPLSGFAT